MKLSTAACQALIGVLAFVHIAVANHCSYEIQHSSAYPANSFILDHNYFLQGETDDGGADKETLAASCFTLCSEQAALKGSAAKLYEGETFQAFVINVHLNQGYPDSSLCTCLKALPEEGDLLRAGGGGEVDPDFVEASHIYGVTVCPKEEEGGDAPTAMPSNEEDEVDEVTSLQGDPHFVGFNGLRFDYLGEPGRTFNVISTPDTQVNAWLKPDMVNGLTYVGSMAISSDGVRVLLSVREDVHHVIVEIDDVPIADEVLAAGPVSRRSATVTRLSADSVQVVVDDLTMVVSIHKNEYLDMQEVSLHRMPTSIHGVLGQTAVPGRTVAGFDGAEEEYFTSGLWSDDFQHNRFVRQASAVETHVVRSPRRMGSSMLRWARDAVSGGNLSSATMYGEGIDH